MAGDRADDDVCRMPLLDECVVAAARCLEHPDTQRRALKALRALAKHGGDPVEALIRSHVLARVRALVSAPSSLSASAACLRSGAGSGTPRDAAADPRGEPPPPPLSVASSVEGLLALVCELPAFRGRELAHELLELSARAAHEPESLLDALLKLQERGVGCAAGAIELVLREQAGRLLRGLAVLQWLHALRASAPRAQCAPLAAALGMAVPAGAPPAEAVGVLQVRPKALPAPRA